MRNEFLLASLLLSIGCAAGSVALPELPGEGAPQGNPAAVGTTGLGKTDADGGVAPGSGTGGGGAGATGATGAIGSTGSSPTGTSGAPVTTNLPCDVQEMLQTKCVLCHSSPPVGGAPMPLVTYADLTAPAKSNPSLTAAQVAVTRIQSTTAPMPPAGNTPPTSTEIAAFGAWVNGGAPQGACGVPDGGLAGAGDGGTEAGPSPYDTPVQCSSGNTSPPNEGSTMAPGEACLSCHSSQGSATAGAKRSDDDDNGGGEGAPIYSLGGTVYPTAHEPIDCAGVDVSGAQVIITDANGQTLTLSVNSAGNFFSSQAIALPFHAKVVYNGNTRAMSESQMTGDCNSCHTVSGANGAPGRIMLP